MILAAPFSQLSFVAYECELPFYRVCVLFLSSISFLVAEFSEFCVLCFVLSGGAMVAADSGIIM